MHRLLLAFLLVFMPLQSIWAAASPYCGHEAAPQASHFGHHEHEHEHQAVAAEDAKAQIADAQDLKVLSGATDMDCHACHGAGNGMAGSASAMVITVYASHPRQLVAPVFLSPLLSRPERPQWPPLA